MAAKLPFYKDPEFMRPQTWLILLAMGMGIVTFFVPVATFMPTEGPGGLVQLYAHRLSYPEAFDTAQKRSVIYFLIALIVNLTLLCSALYHYRRRPSQLMIMRFALASFLILGIFDFWYVSNLATELGHAMGTIYTQTANWGVALRVVGFVAVVAAERMILRDQRRLQAMNRFW